MSSPSNSLGGTRAPSFGICSSPSSTVTSYIIKGSSEYNPQSCLFPNKFTALNGNEILLADLSTLAKDKIANQVFYAPSIASKSTSSDMAAIDICKSTCVGQGGITNTGNSATDVAAIWTTGAGGVDRRLSYAPSTLQLEASNCMCLTNEDLTNLQKGGKPACKLVQQEGYYFPARGPSGSGKNWLSYMAIGETTPSENCARDTAVAPSSVQPPIVMAPSISSRSPLENTALVHSKISFTQTPESLGQSSAIDVEQCSQLCAMPNACGSANPGSVFGPYGSMCAGFELDSQQGTCQCIADANFPTPS